MKCSADQLFNGNMHIVLYFYIVCNLYCHTCHQTLIGQLNIQYHVSLWNKPTCLSVQIYIFMSVCIFFKIKSNVIFTNFYKVLCYMSVLFSLYYRGDPSYVESEINDVIVCCGSMQLCIF